MPAHVLFSDNGDSDEKCREILKALLFYAIATYLMANFWQTFGFTTQNPARNAKFVLVTHRPLEYQYLELRTSADRLGEIFMN